MSEEYKERVHLHCTARDFLFREDDFLFQEDEKPPIEDQIKRIIRTIEGYFSLGARNTALEERILSELKSLV